MAPFISVVLPTHLEGETVRISIESLLYQQFTDFEVIVVHDGGDQRTADILDEYSDPRIVRILQANEGLSVARNRAMQCLRGDYVCFLDADDMRPGWSLAEFAKAARRAEADCFFARGMFVDVDGIPRPFFDDVIFDKLVARLGQPNGVFCTDSLPLEARALLHLLEPTSANKFIRTAFLRRVRLRFPPGLCFEDYFFHLRLVQTAGRVSFIDTPCFTAFRRYGRPHITDASGLIRFDSLNVSRLCLESFRRSNGFGISAIRASFTASMMRHLLWSLGHVSVVYRGAYVRELIKVLDGFGGLIDELTETSIRSLLDEVPPWAQDVLLCARAYKSVKVSVPGIGPLDREGQFETNLAKFFNGLSHGDLLTSYSKRSEELLASLAEKQIKKVLVFGAGEVASCFLNALDRLSVDVQCLGVTVSKVQTAPPSICGRSIIPLQAAIQKDIDGIVVCAINDQSEIIKQLELHFNRYNLDVPIFAI